MNYKEFFGRKSENVARDLLGRLLVRKVGTGATGGRIVETGAYEGGKQTPSRQGMLSEPGEIFLMPYRGLSLLNIASERAGKPSCIEIRTVELHNELIEGPGKISKYFEIGPEFDGVSLGDEVQILGSRASKSKIIKSEGSADNCLGYFSIKK